MRHGKGEKIRCARVQPVDGLRGGGEGSQAGGTHQHRLLRRIPHAPQNLLPPVVKAEHVQVWRGEGGIPLCDAQKSMQRKPTDARMRIALGFHATEQAAERAGERMPSYSLYSSPSLISGRSARSAGDRRRRCDKMAVSIAE